MPLQGRAIPFAEASAIWRKFETDGHVTPYQTSAWLNAWNEAVLARRGEEFLALLVETEAGEAIAAIPVALSRKYGLCIARIPGDDHANFKFPLLSKTRLDSDIALDVISRTLTDNGIDLLVLDNMPLNWEGVENPLSRSLVQSGPTPGVKTSLAGDPLSRLNPQHRKKLRQKHRNLERIAPVEIVAAKSLEEINPVLDAFFEQKSARFKEMGIPNIFLEDGIEDFLRKSALPRHDNTLPALILYALKCGSRVIAIYGGSAHGPRFSAAINSMALDDVRRYSPGDLLLCHVIEDCKSNGYKTFDMGLGAFSYKTTFCPDIELVYDGIIAASFGGKVYGKFWLLARTLKKQLKKSPRLLNLSLALKARLSPAES